MNVGCRLKLHLLSRKVKCKVMGEAGPLRSSVGRSVPLRPGDAKVLSSHTRENSPRYHRSTSRDVWQGRDSLCFCDRLSTPTVRTSDWVLPHRSDRLVGPAGRTFVSGSGTQETGRVVMWVGG